jgi:beta-ribofuranosylaminobenzene 5'-phosphate synthase
LSDARAAVLRQLLLSTDGTVTPMLECLTGQRVAVAGLTQSYVEPSQDIVRLLPDGADGLLLSRRTRLVGTASGETLLRAHSLIVPDALPSALLADLLNTQEPIGRLLRRHRFESYRELVAEPPQHPEQRRYRVFAGGHPVFLLEEEFSFDAIMTAWGGTR